LSIEEDRRTAKCWYFPERLVKASISVTTPSLPSSRWGIAQSGWALRPHRMCASSEVNYKKESPMIKALSVGIGIFLLGLGIAFHAIEKYSVKNPVRAMATDPYSFDPAPAATMDIVTQPWKPWAYMGAGIVLILWTTTLPQKMAGK
jgi:hypothetical protein